MSVGVEPTRVIRLLKARLSDAMEHNALLEAALEESQEREEQLKQQVLSLQHDPEAPE